MSKRLWIENMSWVSLHYQILHIPSKSGDSDSSEIVGFRLDFGVICGLQMQSVLLKCPSPFAHTSPKLDRFRKEAAQWHFFSYELWRDFKSRLENTRSVSHQLEMKKMSLDMCLMIQFYEDSCFNRDQSTPYRPRTYGVVENTDLGVKLNFFFVFHFFQNSVRFFFVYLRKHMTRGQTKSQSMKRFDTASNGPTHISFIVVSLRKTRVSVLCSGRGRGDIWS